MHFLLPCNLALFNKLSTLNWLLFGCVRTSPNECLQLSLYSQLLLAERAGLTWSEPTQRSARIDLEIVPRTASATRALLRLNPCHWSYRRSPAVSGGTSGTSSSLGLTGGEYKTWERIHRSIADLRLLAIPTSWGRVADLNPNWANFYKDLLHLTVLRLVVIGIVSRVRPKASRDMLTWRHPRLPPPPHISNYFD